MLLRPLRGVVKQQDQQQQNSSLEPAASPSSELKICLGGELNPGCRGGSQMTIPLYQLNLSWKVEVILPYLYEGNIFFLNLKIFKTTKKMKIFEKLNFFENF